MPLTGSKIVHPDLVAHVTAWRDRGLPDTCTIKRLDPDTVPTINPTTLVRTVGTPTTIYTGGCAIQAIAASDKAVESGDTTVIIRRYYASIQADADEIASGDILTVTTSGDAALVGHSFVVTDFAFDTFQNRRLLILEEQGRAEKSLGA